MHCSCESYHRNELDNKPYCRHTKEYRELIYKTLYGSDVKIIRNMIHNFKTVKSKVRDVIKDYPELIGESYKVIWKKIEERYPDLNEHKTTTERTYRKIIADAKKGFEEDIEVPVDVEHRTRKQEEIMHDINKWDPDFIDNNGQTNLLPDREGF